MVYYGFGSSEAQPINYEEEPYTFWNFVYDNGETYAENHPDTVIEAMEQYHFFHNAKTNDKQCINKFWSLTKDERINILYDYFNEEIDYWHDEIKKEINQ